MKTLLILILGLTFTSQALASGAAVGPSDGACCEACVDGGRTAGKDVSGADAPEGSEAGDGSAIR